MGKTSINIEKTEEVFLKAIESFTSEEKQILLKLYVEVLKDLKS